MINKKVGIITFDYEPIIGGQGTYIKNIVSQLKTKEIPFKILSPKDSYIFKKMGKFGIRGNNFGPIFFSIYTNFVVNKWIKINNVEVVHTQGGPGGIFLIRKLNIPVIYTCHHTYWQQYTYLKQSWKKVFFYIEKLGYKKSDLVIVDVKSANDILVKKYKINQSKIRIIPLGIKNLSTKNEHVHNANELIYLGRLDFRKGVDFLLKAMVNVNNKYPDIKLNIIGKGDLKINLQNYAKKHNLNVEFHGFLSEENLKKVYKKCIIQVIPSLFEGFGITVLDAMTNGMAVIGTDVDGIRDIIKNKTTGLLVEYNNINQMSQSIFTLIEDMEFRNKLILNAFNDLTLYSMDETYGKTVAIYNEV